MMNDNPEKMHGSFFERHSRKMMWGVIFAALLLYAVPTLTSMSNDPKQTVAWRTDFEAAAAEAQANGKLLLINFTADWCPPCRMMKQQVWPDAHVRQAVQADYIPLLIDVDEEQHRELAERYSIRSIPTLIIASPDGKMRHRASTMHAPQMVRFLQTSADRS